VTLNAQEAERPKLGLVLSGGGARGVAHIGIIKAMEEAGLRPDYIAGTSMGSIIAGLYAVGYSADQMEDIILEIQWDQILTNKVPLNYIAFEEKEYYDRYLVGIPLNNKLKPELGSGLLHGQMLTEVLHHYFWTAMQYENFDEFPIAFRCIGADVNTAKAIVFKDGPLPTALRSSMAIPSVFTAMDFDTTLVVDGGVVNNFPVDIVREMGADYVIGINLGATSSGEAPDDLGSIMMALASIPSKESLQEHIDDCDIYIQPDLGNYSSSSFTSSPEILELGLEQGKLHEQEFKKLAEQIGMSLPPFVMDSVIRPVVLNSISYEGNSLFSNVLIDKKLGVKEGDTVSRDQVEEAIRRVYGINGFDKVEHELKIREDGSADLRVIMKERLPLQLYASVHADNIFSEGIVLNLTARDLLGRDSRSIFTVDISGNPRFRFDYYKYLSVNKKFALNFRYDYARDQLPSYIDGWSS
jgi:NTE family protein